MPVIINGTTGVSGVDGSAGTPSYQGTGTATGLFYPTTTALALSTNGSERLRIDSSGNVGIGTSSPAARLEVAGGVRLSQTGAVPAGLDIGLNGGNGVTGFSSRDASSTWRPLFVEADTTVFFTGSGTGVGVTERMRITSAGDIGIGTSSPGDKLNVVLSSSGLGGIRLQNTNSSGQSAISYYNNAGTQKADVWWNNNGSILNFRTVSTDPMAFSTNNSERMRLNSDGRLLLGATTDATGNPQIRVTGGSNTIAVGSGNGARWKSSGEDNFEFHTYSNTPNPNFLIGYGNGSGGVDTSKERVTVNAGTWSFQNSNLSISGSLSKGSGSFKIDHPLPTKTDTHFLVHSFIEAPQADLIYRGKVQLKNGKATVNIDTAARMSEGTFVLLCRDVQCFTSNESDWDAVRGSVSGNILTIECQNTSSTATISWMVIGERQDPHMYETSWTDNDGRVIVEPEKTIFDEKNIIFSGVIENA